MNSTTIYLDLVTKTGEIVRIECPRKFEDGLHETIEHALKRRDWWSSAQFDGCMVLYLGLRLERVNMGDVIGTL